MREIFELLLRIVWINIDSIQRLLIIQWNILTNLNL